MGSVTVVLALVQLAVISAPLDATSLDEELVNLAMVMLPQELHIVNTQDLKVKKRSASLM